MSNDILIGAELGPEFDKGNIQPNTVRLKLGTGLAIQPDGTIVHVKTTRTIYSEEFAGRSANGFVSDFVRNATMTRTATGRWDVRFTSAHPDGDQYVAVMSAEESGTFRDNPKIIIVQGTQNANGFDVMITLDDNGGTADTYSDQPWSWSVSSPIEVAI